MKNIYEITTKDDKKTTVTADFIEHHEGFLFFHLDDEIVAVVSQENLLFAQKVRTASGLSK